ncbi:MAG TPA: hypothetical protein VIC55_03575 [Gemmatimonadaceae bacterium]
MKAGALFALLAAVAIGVSMVTLMLLFPNAADHEALEVTAVLVFGVHVVSFAISRSLQRWNVWGAWFAGSFLRFAALVVYAVLVSKVLLFPLAPALIGCATFLFLPTLVEPLLLRK